MAEESIIDNSLLDVSSIQNGNLIDDPLLQIPSDQILNDQNNSLETFSHPDTNEEQHQFKPQRKIDEDEIPPSPSTLNEIEANCEKRNSITKELDINSYDFRPLTKLEQPFEEDISKIDQSNRNSDDALNSDHESNQSSTERISNLNENIPSNQFESDTNATFQTESTRIDEEDNNSSVELILSENIQSETATVDETNINSSAELQTDSIENISSNENQQSNENTNEDVPSESGVDEENHHSYNESKTNMNEANLSIEPQIFDEGNLTGEKLSSQLTINEVNSDPVVDSELNSNENISLTENQNLDENEILSVESTTIEDTNKNISNVTESNSNENNESNHMEYGNQNKDIQLISPIAENTNNNFSMDSESNSTENEKSVENSNEYENLSMAESTLDQTNDNRSIEIESNENASTLKSTIVEEPNNSSIESKLNTNEYETEKIEDNINTSKWSPTELTSKIPEDVKNYDDTSEEFTDSNKINMNLIESNISEEQNHLTHVEPFSENNDQDNVLLKPLPSNDFENNKLNENDTNFNDEVNEFNRRFTNNIHRNNEKDLVYENSSDLIENLTSIENILDNNLNDSNEENQKETCLSNNNNLNSSEFEDILGNKTLLKQILVNGQINNHPTRSTLVTVTYELWLIDNITLKESFIENVENEKFFVSEYDIISAIDISVQTMNIGEKALIYSDIRHCYGDLGYAEKQIPPISSNNSYKMKILLELNDWKNPDDIQMLSINERLLWGNKKKQMGNFHYRRQDYEKSLQCYNGALRFLDTDLNPILIACDENEKLLLNENFIHIENNVAQANLLLNKYEACLNAAENVLKYDPKNLKALFRQGKAFFELGLYDKALQPLKLFKQIQKNNSNSNSDQEKVTEMIQICETKLAHYQKNEKEIYQRMFTQKSSSTASTKVNQQSQIKNKKQINNKNNSWWPYIALGGAVITTLAFLTFFKHRKLS